MKFWRLGVDIGGTFTDVVACDADSGEIRSAKVPSRYHDPIEALVSAINAVGLKWSDVHELTHGTTMVTNDIVENRLGDVALISTKGFRDTIAIGRVRRSHIYHLDRLPKLPPLVPAHLRLEVDERVDWTGRVVTPLSDAELARLVDEVKATGVNSVAVCLMHGYRNSIHEKRIGEALSGVVDYVCLSHEISPESREYERSNTTILSASVINRVRSYLTEISAHKPEKSSFYFFHSSGGMVAPNVIGNNPLLLAMSGPAAGVAATVGTIQNLGIDKALTFDMGGTTTDCCLILDGKAEIAADHEIGGRRVRLPMVAVHSIGAGGGSIARMDGPVLQVGPRSAGATPGPACFGRGGTEPTISDANIVLGYLPADKVLGNTIQLDRQAAVSVIQPIADAIGKSVEDVAIGILRIAHSNMVRALNNVTVERGVDGRECTLIAFGGGGPMHAAFVARQFGIKKVLCPAFSSGYSALGCVTAKMTLSQQRTVNIKSVFWDQAEVDAIRRDLRQVVSKQMLTSSHKEGNLKTTEVALIHYSGQSYDVPVPNANLDDVQALGRQFHAAHDELFGFFTDEPWELSAIRTTVEDVALKTAQTDVSAIGGNPEIGLRDCTFREGGTQRTAILDRSRLPVGKVIAGPAIIEDEWSTIIVPPNDTFEADSFGHIHIQVGEG